MFSAQIFSQPASFFVFATQQASFSSRYLNLFSQVVSRPSWVEKLITSLFSTLSVGPQSATCHPPAAKLKDPTSRQSPVPGLEDEAPSPAISLQRTHLQFSLHVFAYHDSELPAVCWLKPHSATSSSV
jgi:hypothetical protein